MSGFSLEYTDGDHHVDEIGAQLWPAGYKMTLRDKNSDDDYDFNVWWVNILP